jgi:hypothetical protein
MSMNLLVVVAIVWWMGIAALLRRERARDDAASYQMSGEWLARWHQTHSVSQKRR